MHHRAATPFARLARLGAALAMSAAAAGASPALATDSNGHATAPEDRAEAESKLEAVKREIEQLQARLESSRDEHRREQGRVRRIDLDIQAANQALRSLDARREDHRQEVARLEARREAYLQSLTQRMEELSEQLRGAYRSGRQSRMKLVLNQDDPAQLSRMLAYYDFFNRAQVNRIAQLREALSTLAALKDSIDEELTRLAELAEEQRQLLERLDAQRQRRQVLLAELADQIGGEEARLKELERNRQDLEALLERLTDVLADIPADLGDHLGVAAQKGRLPMPLDGRVQHAFGQSRSGGLHWQGWLIGAEPGTEVGAIAYGRVAFADWLRGYGLLIIIDHGQGFMTLYGHNESLLHEVGAWVEPGEIISVVGSNPGSDQGLYFELRKGGKAIDPAAWLAR